MNNIKIGIIGGTGGMGRWFAEFLQSEGYDVYVTGRKTPLCANRVSLMCDVVVVSVPISATAAVIQEVAPLLSEDKLLMDLTSLKRNPLELMIAQSRAEVVGCHPLFGPAIKDAAGQNVVLCPGRGRRWYAWLKSLFGNKGFTVLERTAAEHDEMMAIVQVLNHLNTITLGITIAKSAKSLDEINKFSTPIFKTKMEIVKKVFSENPSLYAEIIEGNPAADQILDRYEQALQDVRKAIKTERAQGLKILMENSAKNIFG